MVIVSKSRWFVYNWLEIHKCIQTKQNTSKSHYKQTGLTNISHVWCECWLCNHTFMIISDVVDLLSEVNAFFLFLHGYHVWVDCSLLYQTFWSLHIKPAGDVSSSGIRNGSRNKNNWNILNNKIEDFTKIHCYLN